MSTFVATDAAADAAAQGVAGLTVNEPAASAAPVSSTTAQAPATVGTEAATTTTAPTTATTTTGTTVPATASTKSASEDVPKKIIDWDEALASIGGGEDFLQEVVNDLLKEAVTAEADIKKGIDEENMATIMKAAHRIGGSASYFNCEDLVFRAHAIKNAAVEVKKVKDASPDAPLAGTAVINDLLALHAKFVASAGTLRAAADERFKKATA